MISNYLKIAWRNLKNNKFFSLINISGLAIGLACCMLISLYLVHEFSFDRHHQKSDRIYQVGTVFVNNDKNNPSPGTPSPVGPTLQREYPEIESITRYLSLFVDDKTLLQYKEGNNTKSFYESKGYMADSTFFSLFDYDFVEGNAVNSLMQPNSVVLSEEIARKMFGNGSALNKTITINSSTNGVYDYKVTGVFKKSKNPSHLDARFILSLSSGDFGEYVKTATNFSYNNMFSTYVLLKEGTDPKKLESKFPAFVKKYMTEDLKSAGFGKQQFLVALKDIHLRSGFGNSVKLGGDGVYGNLKYLFVLGSIAVFILIIACINFMNLSTARSAKRAAEVGIRKVLGAEKKYLIRQFLGESVFLAMISLLLAFGIMKLLIPFFSNVSGVELSFGWSEQGRLILVFFLLALTAGLIAGVYPAFYLSAFKPIKVLKGRFSNSLSAVTLRKGLVVFQFTISAGLIICAIVIGKQMNYMRNVDMGFTADQQIVIPLRSSNAKNMYTSFKNELQQNKEINTVGASLYYPGIFNASDNNYYLPGKSIKESTNMKMNWVDYSFLRTLDIKPIAGRIFSESFPGDTSNNLVLNESAVKKLGFSDAQKAIGAKILANWSGEIHQFSIIGVVKNFNFESLQNPIQPFAFQLARTTAFNYMIAHVASADLSGALKSIESSWKQLNPQEPFEYSFLDQDFQKNYEAEIKLSALIKYFMFIAIAICCLGLFGLAAFSGEQRMKEMGIRKVLGSSVTNIVGLMSKDFVKLVLIGNLIAIPIAWYLMNNWLNEFAFRTNINGWVFAIAFGISISIAFITISYQAMKSAFINPIRTLRSE